MLKRGKLILLAFFALALLCSVMGLGTVLADTDTSLPSAAGREAIRGIDVRLESGTLNIVTEYLKQSYSEETEGEKSKYAIFEFVLDEASSDPGEYFDKVLWGDGMTPNYGLFFPETSAGHYNAEMNYKWTDSAFVSAGNTGKRIIVIINRDVADWKTFAVEANEQPVFVDTDGVLTVSNGVLQPLGPASGEWRGALGGTLSYSYDELNPIIKDCTNAGFGFSRPGTEISGLKCYNERGENLGIVFFEYPGEFTVTNLDDHADDNYWMTGNPSDTKFIEPTNYNYRNPLSATAETDTTTEFNNINTGDVKTGFYASGDGLFTSVDFGSYNGVLHPDGGAVVFGRVGPFHHKAALEFGRTIDVNSISSITMRVWGTQLYHGDPDVYVTLNSHLLFNLNTENFWLDGRDNDCINLRGFVPEQYTAVNKPTDFIDVTIPSSELVKLADADGKIKGFQFVMMDGNDYNDYFIIDSIRINETYNLTYEADGGTHDNPGTWVLGDPSDLADAVKEDYDFLGWYTSENFEEDTKITELTEYTITKDTTLYARYAKKQFKVTYLSNAGLDIPSVMVAWGEQVPEPVLPDVENMEFDKWTMDGEDYTFGVMPKNDIILTAVYKGEKFSIIAQSQGKSQIDIAVEAEYFSEIDFTVTADAGYEIKNLKVVDNNQQEITCFSENGIYSFTMPASDVTVTYTVSVVTYLITYENCEGINNPNPFSYSVEQNVTFADISADGKVFEGWYTDAEFTDKVTSTEGLTGNLTVYAKFSQNSGCSGAVAGADLSGGLALLLVTVLFVAVKCVKAKQGSSKK